jgi:hypothetical protein
MDAPVVASRQNIFSETPASDFSRQAMVLDWINISSKDGMPFGNCGDFDKFSFVI